MARILNCKKSINTHKDWTPQAAGLNLTSSSTLPKVIDYSTQLNTVYDQGETGSCVGQGFSGVLSFYYKNIKMAPFYIWEAAKATDGLNSYVTTFLAQEGTTLKAALEIVKNYGAAPETYFDSEDSQMTAVQFYAGISQYKIASYFNLQSTDDIIQWLLSKGPILTRMEVDSSFMDYKGGILMSSSGDVLGGHALCIAGWDGTSFLIRNSWGVAWGEKGYARVSPDYFRSKFTESYGIQI